jgi:hypothetical protein
MEPRLGRGIRYQEKLFIYDINTSPVVLTLPYIPMLDPVRASDDSINFSVEQFQLENCTATFERNDVVLSANSTVFSPMHNWLLSDDWVKKWGVGFNIMG